MIAAKSLLAVFQPEGAILKTKLAAFLVIIVPSFAVYAQNLDGNFLPSASDKNPVPKISFEQRTGVLVWDIGAKTGFVDAGDDLTDLGEECGIADSSIIPDPVKIISEKSLDVNQLNKTVASIL